ncbi:MAG: response regulator [Ktedonobacteraceae bacterium]
MSERNSHGEPYTILVVEADAEIGSLLLEALSQKASYQMILLTHSLQALQVARGIKPDLFILNYHLPQVNGIELYDRLHAIKGLKHVPTIMVAADLPEQEVEQRKIVSLKKPSGMDELLDAIQKALM